MTREKGIDCSHPIESAIKSLIINSVPTKFELYDCSRQFRIICSEKGTRELSPRLNLALEIFDFSVAEYGSPFLQNLNSDLQTPSQFNK